MKELIWKRIRKFFKKHASLFVSSLALIVSWRACSIQSNQAGRNQATDRPLVTISFPKTDGVFASIDFSRSDTHDRNSLAGIVPPQETVEWPITPNFHNMLMDHGYFMADFSYRDAFSSEKYEGYVIGRFVRQDDSGEKVGVELQNVSDTKL